MLEGCEQLTAHNLVDLVYFVLLLKRPSSCVFVISYIDKVVDPNKLLAVDRRDVENVRSLMQAVQEDRPPSANAGVLIVVWVDHVYLDGVIPSICQHD